MKIKTSELTGVALDWAVAKCIGQPDEWMADHRRGYINSASTDWAQGGPIIERENISAISHNKPNHWVARTTSYPPTYFRGPTPLIAAMRCYVASKLGDEVEVPDELA